MGKKKIYADKRKKAIIGLSLLLAADLLMLIFFGLIGFQVSKDVKSATYKTKSEIEYDLTLDDDPVYNESLLDLGSAYIMRYVDQLNLTFNYFFDSSKLEAISGDYSVIGELAAEFNSKEQLWKKEYTFIPKTSFSSGQAVDSYSLKVNEYRDLVQTIQDQTDISVTATMTITCTVNVTAQVDGEPVTGTSVSTLVFDLNQDVLVLSGEPLNEKEQSITKAVEQDLIAADTALVISIPIFSIIAGALLFILLATEGVSPDLYKEAFKQIIKKYGSRIIELKNGDVTADYETISVKTFRDLLLIADELKKPIYKNSAANLMDAEYHVIDNVRKYIFRIQDISIIEKPISKLMR